MRRRRRFIQRKREVGHLKLVNDYLPRTCVSGSYISKKICITNALEVYSSYFAIRKRLLPLRNYTDAIRQLAYGVSADLLDEYLRIGESADIECLSSSAKLWLSYLVIDTSEDRMQMMFNVFFKYIKKGKELYAPEMKK
ncbi:uncharacterized protein LOC142526086 [Primulina tabacum]|uniref:uncharacterized protein LOC142526086 n=1 Tax=Primulina tabacum TaxID=48773 RepID=UPI003F593190